MRMVQDVLTRLRAEFLEMPGLRLKSEQVQRLCGVEGTICKIMLDALVNEGFLRVGSDGRYARLTTERAHPAQSDLRTGSP